MISSSAVCENYLQLCVEKYMYYQHDKKQLLEQIKKAGKAVDDDKDGEKKSEEEGRRVR